MGSGMPKQLAERLDKYPFSDVQFISKAYLIAEEAHRSQKRPSGEPYINHCVGVAAIIADFNVPANVVAAALLHDIVAETDFTRENLEVLFGSEVANLVEEVSRMITFVAVSHSSENSDWNLAVLKNLLTMGMDVRVMLILLADRLHNMRTLGYLPADMQKQMAKVTLDIFAPLANRLGIWPIRSELEDLGFRYLDPEMYKEIVTKVGETRSAREHQIEQIIDAVENLLANHEIKGVVSGRVKNIYSIYLKMKSKMIAFSNVHDIRGVRIIVEDIASCYSVLGLVHSKWRPLTGEFDDYIAAPKENSYQSLHTTIIYDDGKTVEIQIRTQEMHENAEYGLAAQWRHQ